MQEARLAQALRMLAEYRDFAAKARAASLHIVQLHGTRQVPNQPERS